MNAVMSQNASNWTFLPYECHGLSNQQQFNCLFNSLFRPSNKIKKLQSYILLDFFWVGNSLILQKKNTSHESSHNKHSVGLYLNFVYDILIFLMTLFIAFALTGGSQSDGNGYGVFRADSRFAPSQWETPLLCNGVSHWLGPNLESALGIANNHSHHEI